MNSPVDIAVIQILISLRRSFSQCPGCRRTIDTTTIPVLEIVFINLYKNQQNMGLKLILPKYRVERSKIENAGQGVFLGEDVEKGAIIVVPDNIKQILTEHQLTKFGEDSIENKSSVRWFENFYTICPEWTDECFINHSFEPTGLWHLGFVFALDDLQSGVELTIDYRHLIGHGYALDFKDSHSGKPIVGLHWRESLRKTATMLLEILDAIDNRDHGNGHWQKAKQNGV